MNKFISFFDVLGFSQVSIHTSPIVLFEIYRDIIANAEIPVVGRGRDASNLFVFSDTICVTEPETEHRSDEQAIQFFRTAGLLLHNSIVLSEQNAKNPPLRGAIGYGSYLAKKDAQFIEDSPNTVPLLIGRGVVEAYQWEQSQKWVGASLVPDNISILLEEQSDLVTKLISNGYIVEYDVPTKDGIQRSFAINYVTQGHAEPIYEYFSTREKTSSMPVSPKYRASRIFVEKMIDEKNWFPEI
jgi:hypothetical protein